MSERAFDFLHVNDRPEKPRTKGITEIRGPYYDPMGPRELRDILETMGQYVDIYKFSGGSFALMDRDTVEELIGICHDYDVEVSTGGFIENVLVRDNDKVEDYVAEAKTLGFDIVEISSGFLAIDTEDLVALTELTADYGLKPKPEINVQFGAGGASDPDDLEREGQQDPSMAIREGQRHLDAGADLLMVEAEGITEEVHEWRTDVLLTYEGSEEPETFSPYRLADRGTNKKQWRDLSAGDALAETGIENLSTENRNELDYENLLTVDPDVLLIRGHEDKSPEAFQETVLSYMRDHPVGGELTAVQDGRVYRGGLLWEGPIQNLFLTEQAAKQLYPDQFGRVTDDQRLFDRQRIADIIDGEF